MIEEEMKIEELASLTPGGVYVLRCKRPLIHEDMVILRAILARDGERAGVHFILLDSCIEMVKPVAVEPVQGR